MGESVSKAYYGVCTGCKAKLPLTEFEPDSIFWSRSGEELLCPDCLSNYSVEPELSVEPTPPERHE